MLGGLVSSKMLSLDGPAERHFQNRPAPALRGFQEAPPVLIADRNGRARRRNSGHGEPRLGVECILFEPREELYPAEASESTAK